MEDFEERKKRRILETKKRLKSYEDGLEKLKSKKIQKNMLIVPTAQQIEKFSKKTKKRWAETLKMRERFFTLKKTLKTNLELTKRELKAIISAKCVADMLEITCQECGEVIFGTLCDLCGRNNDSHSNTLKIAKEEMLRAEKLGLSVGEIEKTVEVYESLIMEKKKNDEIEQFVLDVMYAWGSCKECGKKIDSGICDGCGFDNSEHKKNTMIEEIDKLSKHYKIPFKEAVLLFQENMKKLEDEGKIYIKY